MTGKSGPRSPCGGCSFLLVQRTSARYLSAWSSAMSSRRGSCRPFHVSRRCFTPSARSGRLYSSRSHFSKSPRAKCSTTSRPAASFRCSTNAFGSSVLNANQLAGPESRDPSRLGLKTRSFKVRLVSRRRAADTTVQKTPAGAPAGRRQPVYRMRRRRPVLRVTRVTVRSKPCQGSLGCVVRQDRSRELSGTKRTGARCRVSSPRLAG